MSRLAVLVIVAGCGSRPPPSSVVTKEPSAAEIVKRMQATYAGAKTYSDHGTVRSSDGMLSFETTFVRSARFRFVFRNENNPQKAFTLWADGTHTYSRWYGPPRMSDDGPGLAIAVALAAKPSGGVLQTIAHLVRPDEIPDALTTATLAGTEIVDEHPCWIVTAKHGDNPSSSELRLWIDRDSYLLRRSTDDDSDLTSYTPVLGGALDIAAIQPPDFSDDYEEGSPQMVAVRALVNAKAPDFDAEILNNPNGGPGRATLSKLTGHVVVVDFWATWCGPCQMTMPRINEWHRKYESRGLRIVGLSSEDPDDIKKLVADKGLVYTIARDDNAVAAHAYKATAIPMLVVVDKAGIVRYVTLGAGGLDQVETVIETLLR